MTTDRAGPKGPSTERRVEARMGLFGFYAAITVDIDLPWMPTPSALQAILDVINSAGPWELTHDNGLIPEALDHIREPAKPTADPE